MSLHLLLGDYLRHFNTVQLVLIFLRSNDRLVWANADIRSDSLITLLNILLIHCFALASLCDVLLWQFDTAKEVFGLFFGFVVHFITIAGEVLDQLLRVMLRNSGQIVVLLLIDSICFADYHRVILKLLRKVKVALVSCRVQRVLFKDLLLLELLYLVQRLLGDVVVVVVQTLSHNLLLLVIIELIRLLLATSGWPGANFACGGDHATPLLGRGHLLWNDFLRGHVFWDSAGDARLFFYLAQLLRSLVNVGQLRYAMVWSLINNVAAMRADHGTLLLGD